MLDLCHASPLNAVLAMKALPRNRDICKDYQRGKSYDVNRRVVYRALEAGTGSEGLSSFCGIMNMQKHDNMKKQTKYKQATNSLNDLLLKEIYWRAKFSTKSRTERGTLDAEDLSWKNYTPFL